MPASDSHRWHPLTGGIVAALGTVMVITGCSPAAPETGAATPTLSKRAAEAAVQAEFQQRQDACMGERGFPVTVFDDGGRQYAGSGSLGQAGLLDLLAECADAVGGEPPREPLSEGDLSALYDLDVEAYECLVAAGYEPVPPPTREQYIATYGTEGSWIPFGPGMPTGTNPEDPCSQPRIADIPDQE